MARKSPIDIRDISKSGLLDESRFYRLLSEQNNYVDAKTVKDFYMGFVRTVTKEMRDNGIIRLPHLGDFVLMKKKDSPGLAGKYSGMLVGKYMLKFFPSEKWKKYFSILQKKSGAEGRLDPREKILGRILE
jgi:nucleoid DNA-binding protein